MCVYVCAHMCMCVCLCVCVCMCMYMCVCVRDRFTPTTCELLIVHLLILIIADFSWSKQSKVFFIMNGVDSLHTYMDANF